MKSLIILLILLSVISPVYSETVLEVKTTNSINNPETLDKNRIEIIRGEGRFGDEYIYDGIIYSEFEYNMLIDSVLLNNPDLDLSLKRQVEKLKSDTVWYWTSLSAAYVGVFAGEILLFTGFSAEDVGLVVAGSILAAIGIAGIGGMFYFEPSVIMGKKQFTLSFNRSF